MDKVIGIGLNKTGTTTLGMCLQHWGYRHRTFDLPAFEAHLRGDAAGWRRILDAVDSAEDWPWFLLYEQIDRLYPGTRFVLTVRRSPEVWFRSLCKHAVNHGPLRDFEARHYGHAFPHGRLDEYVRIYERHERAARAYFAGRDDQFRVLCWEHGDGWQELAEFLGRDAPAIPFPHGLKSPRWLYSGPRESVARANNLLVRAGRLAGSPVRRLQARLEDT